MLNLVTHHNHPTANHTTTRPCALPPTPRVTYKWPLQQPQFRCRRKGHVQDLIVANAARRDYAPAGSDEGVLKLPSRTELDPDQVANVFNYKRDLMRKYLLGQVIGAGSFGTVYMGIQKKTGLEFAVKSIPKVPRNFPTTPRYLLKLRNEVEVMQQLGNSLDAVYLEDVFEDDDHIHLVMELCKGGSLTDLMHSEQELLSERAVASIMHSMTRFIAQCHAKGIIYRDIKPDNFLYQGEMKISPLKATDFGLSIPYRHGDPKLRGRSGTPAYMAPEVILQAYDEKADVWSLGMLAYQLLTGAFPYMEDVNTAKLQAVWKSVLQLRLDLSDENPQVAHLSSLAKDFLSKTLARDSDLRSSARDLLTHPWLKADISVPDTPFKSTIVQRLQRFATYGYLKQIILRMLMDQMSQEDQQSEEARRAFAEITDQFYEMSTSTSFSSEDTEAHVSQDEVEGTISLEDWKQALAKQFRLTPGEAAQLMAKVDIDHSGSVDYKELAASLIDWCDLRVQEKKFSEWVDKVFNMLDLNGDGNISLQELLARLRSQWRGGDDEALVADAKKLLREADENGDGMISRQEFGLLIEDVCTMDTLDQYDTRLVTTAPKQE